MSTAPTLAKLREVLARYFRGGGRRVFLFGSRADGTARDGSDWDVGVLGPAEIPGHVLERAREDLENLRTLHSIELVDLARTSDAFRRAALQNAIPLIGELPVDD